MKISSPFLHAALPTNKLMMLVCCALIPGAIAQIYFFGYGVVFNLIACASFAIAAEFTILKLRKRNPWKTLRDNSALLSGLLIGLAIPPTLPIWMSFIGVCFAIIFAKQLYGGLGFNPFNPAMVGYVLLLISFPVEMTSWLPAIGIAPTSPDMIESLQLILFSETSAGKTVNDFALLADGFTMATPLDFAKTQFTLGQMTSEIFTKHLFVENLNGWLWVNLSYLAGGIYLLSTKLIRWHIPFAVLGGIVLTSFLLNSYDAELFTPIWFHLVSGATMLGAFFIATDPVSAATTPKGRIIYGLLIGFLVVIIRTFGGYPEAMAFAVLLLNIATPTIDHYTKPRIYGHGLTNESEQ